MTQDVYLGRRIADTGNVTACGVGQMIAVGAGIVGSRWNAMDMTIHIFKRHAYDDVTLLASNDAEASRWKLEVQLGETSEWHPVPAKLMDSHLNWSTPDLSLWDGLRSGDAAFLREVFPQASKVLPAGEFAVMWDVSDWVYGKLRHLFRFTDPTGKAYEFQHDWAVREHTFG